MSIGIGSPMPSAVSPSVVRASARRPSLPGRSDGKVPTRTDEIALQLVVISSPSSMSREDHIVMVKVSSEKWVKALATVSLDRMHMQKPVCLDVPTLDCKRG